jgi:hypothetical protein
MGLWCFGVVQSPEVGWILDERQCNHRIPKIPKESSFPSSLCSLYSQTHTQVA